MQRVVAGGGGALDAPVGSRGVRVVPTAAR